VWPVAAAPAERVTAFLRAVYAWMFVGLAVTATIAAAIASSPAVVQMLASNRLRVVHVSTHVSLRRAIELVAPERIMTTARLAGTKKE
jgi:4-hydroxy-L-threonine phosphate dehydrogenase PdxA